MSEQAWANRQEWAEEKRRGFDVEVKQSFLAPNGYECQEHRCAREAWRVYVVGRVDKKGGMEIGFCNDHDDIDRAIELYREAI